MLILICFHSFFQFSEAEKVLFTAIGVTSSLRDIYFHTPSRNQTSYDLLRNIGLKVL